MATNPRPPVEVQLHHRHQEGSPKEPIHFFLPLGKGPSETWTVSHLYCGEDVTGTPGQQDTDLPSPETPCARRALVRTGAGGQGTVVLLRPFLPTTLNAGAGACNAF